jgi:hypothetical protein
VDEEAFSINAATGKSILRSDSKSGRVSSVYMNKKIKARTYTLWDLEEVVFVVLIVNRGFIVAA